MINRYLVHSKLEYIVGIICVFLALVLGVWIAEHSIKKIAFIVIGLVGVTIVFFKPSVLLFLFFLFIPLELFTLLPSQTLTKFIGLLLGSFFFMNLALKKRISFPQGVKLFWILLYGIAAILSLLVAKEITISYLMSLWLLIGMYFILFFSIRDLKTLHIGILCLLIGGFLSVALNFVIGQGWVSQGYIVKGTRSVEKFTRMGGLWGDPNEFASILLVLLPLSLLFFFRSKSFLVKVIAAGLFATLLVGFFRTYSRGGFIGFLVLLIFSVFKFDLFKRGSNKLKILLSIVALLVIGTIVFYTVSETFIERMETLRRGEGPQASSIQSRIEAYLTALRLFLENPLLGVGLRNFGVYNIYSPLKVVHNTYLEVLACTGLLGFIPFVAILYLSWRELKKIQIAWKGGGNIDSPIYQYAVALELGFIAYFVSALFITLDIEKMTWMLVTLSSVLWNISSRIKDSVYYNEKESANSVRFSNISRR